MSTLSRILKILLAHVDDAPASEGVLAGEYPGVSWGTIPWSFRLLLDWLSFQAYQERRSVFGSFVFKPDLHSFHHDFSSKLFLFRELLELRKKTNRILVPEAGPCGFDVLVALIAGFDHVVVYERDPVFLKCLREIYGNCISEYIQSETDQFDFSPYLRGYVIVAADWFHGSNQMQNQAEFETKPSKERGRKPFPVFWDQKTCRLFSDNLRAFDAKVGTSLP